jgi:hypothetical protein
MAKRTAKVEADINQLAASIVARTTGNDSGKNPAAVALGRLGGLKGGHARARKLSKAKRRLIAKKAARVRWERKKS